MDKNFCPFGGRCQICRFRNNCVMYKESVEKLQKEGNNTDNYDEIEKIAKMLLKKYFYTDD